MTFTYDGAFIYVDGYETSTVRFLLNDRTSSAISLSDEEIAAVLEEQSDDIYATASQCAGIMAIAWAAQGSSRTIGDLSISSGGGTNPYLALVTKYAALVTGGAQLAGGFAANSTLDGYARFHTGQFGLTDLIGDDATVVVV